MRCTVVNIPIIEAGRRVIWCPRAFRSQNVNAPDIGGYIGDVSASLGMLLLNRLPEWDEDLQCLVMKFHGNRISSPSSRNILLYESRKLQRKKTRKDLTTDEAVLQFGKKLPNLYVLDFKYPLSPLQAFSIALTTFVFGSNDPQDATDDEFAP